MCAQDLVNDVAIHDHETSHSQDQEGGVVARHQFVIVELLDHAVYETVENHDYKCPHHHLKLHITTCQI